MDIQGSWDWLSIVTQTMSVSNLYIFSVFQKDSVVASFHGKGCAVCVIVRCRPNEKAKLSKYQSRWSKKPLSKLLDEQNLQIMLASLLKNVIID